MGDSSSQQRYRPLHSYVPFYFATRTPMLYVQYKKGLQDKINIFEVPRSLLKRQRVLFTDGNASNQQLAKYGREQVIISPATALDNPCRRKYLPNANCSNVYSDVSFLDSLDWESINNIRYVVPSEEYTRVKHAEVLVPDLLPLAQVEGIVVKLRDSVQAVNALIEESGLKGRIPSAMCKPGLYF